MNLFINKSVRKFLIRMALILVAGAAVLQGLVYVDTLYFKELVITHDYELAGYLKRIHPELEQELQAAFTAEKASADAEVGKALLEQSGYKQSTELFLVPKTNSFYRSSAAVSLGFSVLLGFFIILAALHFLEGHFKAIDRYNDDINKIMDGFSARLEDSEEGSLPKLAASINVMTSSLYAHIEKEKLHRVFMKDILENVSHQLKTPLAALSMYNEIMRDEEAHNEVISKFLGKSDNELERMQALIAGLLKLARLDAGIIELNRKSCSLKELAEKVAESFEVRLQKEQKTFEIIAERDVEYPCDREWMHEALSNLFKNAVEHTKPGNHIRITVEEAPLIVKVSVADNGEGIHSDDINHIFKRFYRSRFSQDKQGTGIGLTLVKTIVEMHGGFIAVESKAGKGAKFIVHLPNLQNCKLE